MIAVALRFAETFAPETGTINAHQEIIAQYGFVWYGKLGLPISEKNQQILLQNDDPKILLVHSGKSDRYWAHFDKMQRDMPEEGIPPYYGEMINKMKTWFRVTKIEAADKSVMSKCFVKSSGVSLTEVSKHSISPYFIINYQE